MEHKHSDILNDETIDLLLEGDTSLDLLDAVTISEITQNVRLKNVYERSGARNLSEFLKLGKKRTSMRNYGKTSERLLKSCLKEFLSNSLDRVSANLASTTLLATQASNQLDYKHLQNELKKSRKIRKNEWRIIRNDLSNSELAKCQISAVAAELDLAWPISPKSEMSSKKIGDFLSMSLEQILEMQGFGRKKLIIYLQCVVYLHEQLQNEEISSEELGIPERIRRVIRHGRLTEREEKVLRLRFGIQNDRKHTLAEIKEFFGVTRERVRQIEMKALKKLRMSRYYKDLSRLLIEKKELIWEQLSDGTRLRKQEWMQPLEDRLGFEYQIALEICDVRGNRNPNTSVLANWLDAHFPHDETYWYRTEQPLDFEVKNRDEASNELLEFIEQL